MPVSEQRKQKDAQIIAFLQELYKAAGKEEALDLLRAQYDDAITETKKIQVRAGLPFRYAERNVPTISEDYEAALALCKLIFRLLGRKEDERDPLFILEQDLIGKKKKGDKEKRVEASILNALRKICEQLLDALEGDKEAQVKLAQFIMRSQLIIVSSDLTFNKRIQEILGDEYNTDHLSYPEGVKISKEKQEKDSSILAMWQELGKLRVIERYFKQINNLTTDKEATEILARSLEPVFGDRYKKFRSLMKNKKYDEAINEYLNTYLAYLIDSSLDEIQALQSDANDREELVRKISELKSMLELIENARFEKSEILGQKIAQAHEINNLEELEELNELLHAESESDGSLEEEFGDIDEDGGPGLEEVLEDEEEGLDGDEDILEQGFEEEEEDSESVVFDEAAELEEDEYFEDNPELEDTPVGAKLTSPSNLITAMAKGCVGEYEVSREPDKKGWSKVSKVDGRKSKPVCRIKETEPSSCELLLSPDNYYDTFVSIFRGFEQEIKDGNAQLSDFSIDLIHLNKEKHIEQLINAILDAFPKDTSEFLDDETKNPFKDLFEIELSDKGKKALRGFIDNLEKYEKNKTDDKQVNLMRALCKHLETTVLEEYQPSTPTKKRRWLRG